MVLLERTATGSAPSLLLVAYIEHAISVDLVPATTLLRVLARGPLAITGAVAAALLPLVADVLPIVRQPGVSWYQFLQESVDDQAGAWSAPDVALAVLDAVILADRATADRSADERGDGGSAHVTTATAAALRIVSVIAHDPRLAGLLHIALHEQPGALAGKGQGRIELGCARRMADAELWRARGVRTSGRQGPWTLRPRWPRVCGRPRARRPSWTC